MKAALIRRFTREGFMLTTAPMMRAGARAAETVFGLLHPRGTYRLRVGARVTALEGREHDTPTGRCSAGKWSRFAAYPTPTTLGEASVTLSQVWGVILGEGTLSPTEFSGVMGYTRGDHNRCHSRVNADAHDPTFGPSGSGRGRVVRGLPTRRDGFDAHFGVGTHCPGKVRARALLESRREASRAYRNTRRVRV